MLRGKLAGIHQIATISCMLTLIVNCNLQAATYYVSNDGDNATDGLTMESAWQTISHVNDQTFSPGDSILFRCGDEWYEELIIDDSGTSVSPITYGSYGEGEKPAIYGSIKLDAWTNVTDNIWVSVLETEDPSAGAPHDGQTQGSGYRWPGGAWFQEHDGDVTWGRQEKYIDFAGDYSELLEEYDWGWYDNHIYIYCPEDPAVRYVAMQPSQRQTCIKMPNNAPEDHIVIDGLTLRFAQSKGYFDGYPEYAANGLTFTNCNIGFIGIKNGASAYGLAVWHSDMLARDNVFSDCGRRAFSYNTYTSTGNIYENILVENNKFYNGHHTTSIDVTPHDTDTVRNFTFRNNYIEEDRHFELTLPEGSSSEGMYIDASHNSSIYNMYIYNNIVVNAKCRSCQISYADEVYIFHNTFYGSNDYAQPYSLVKLYACSNVHFKNNIVYGNLPRSSFLAYCMISGSSQFAECDNNLYYNEDPAQGLWQDDFNGSFSMQQWSEYQTETGYDNHSPAPSDPLFIDTPNTFELSKNSPAVGAGEFIDWIAADFYGNPRSNPPDIGAVEYNEDRERARIIIDWNLIY